MKNRNPKRCVSFIGSDAKGHFVAGNHELYVDSPIKDIEDIKSIQDSIAMKNNLVTVAIINIMNYEEI